MVLGEKGGGREIDTVACATHGFSITSCQESVRTPVLSALVSCLVFYRKSFLECLTFKSTSLGLVISDTGRFFLFSSLGI